MPSPRAARQHQRLFDSTFDMLQPTGHATTGTSAGQFAHLIAQCVSDERLSEAVEHREQYLCTERARRYGSAPLVGDFDECPIFEEVQRSRAALRRDRRELGGAIGVAHVHSEGAHGVRPHPWTQDLGARADVPRRDPQPAGQLLPGQRREDGGIHREHIRSPRVQASDEISDRPRCVALPGRRERRAQIASDATGEVPRFRGCDHRRAWPGPRCRSPGPRERAGDGRQRRDPFARIEDEHATPPGRSRAAEHDVSVAEAFGGRRGEMTQDIGEPHVRIGDHLIELRHERSLVDHGQRRERSVLKAAMLFSIEGGARHRPLADARNSALLVPLQRRCIAARVPLLLRIREQHTGVKEYPHVLSTTIGRTRIASHDGRP